MDCGRGGSRILKRGVLKVHNNYVGGLGVCLPGKFRTLLPVRLILVQLVRCYTDMDEFTFIQPL